MPVESTHENLLVFEKPTLGRNVSIDIHFIRHGAKKKDGTLRRDAKKKAEKLGEKIAFSHQNEPGVFCIYSGTKERVRDTAEAIREGYLQERKVDVLENISELPLLSHTTFLLDEKKSTYFKKANEKLERAFDTSPLRRRRRINEIERENIHEWVESGKSRIDDGTASPWEVAQNTIRIIANCLTAMDSMRMGSHGDFIMVTHEYILAALIRYVLTSTEGGIRRSGREIFSYMTNIKYLEDITIHIKSDEYGEKFIEASIHGKTYTIQLDQADLQKKMQYLLIADKDVA